MALSPSTTPFVLSHKLVNKISGSLPNSEVFEKAASLCTFNKLPFKTFSAHEPSFFSYLTILYIIFFPPEYNYYICKNKILVFLLHAFTCSSVYSH